MLNRQLVSIHALHVLQDNGLHMALHETQRVLWHSHEYIIGESGVAAELVDCVEFLSVKMQGIISPNVFIAVKFGHPVQGEALVGRCPQHVAPEGDIGFVVVQVTEHGGHDVDLLHHTLLVIAVKRRITWGIQDDGYTVVAQGGAVERVDLLAHMVGSDDK